MLEDSCSSFSDGSSCWSGIIGDEGHLLHGNLPPHRPPVYTRSEGTRSNGEVSTIGWDMCEYDPSATPLRSTSNPASQSGSPYQTSPATVHKWQCPSTTDPAGKEGRHSSVSSGWLMVGGSSGASAHTPASSASHQSPPHSPSSDDLMSPSSSPPLVAQLQPSALSRCTRWYNSSLFLLEAYQSAILHLLLDHHFSVLMTFNSAAIEVIVHHTALRTYEQQKDADDLEKDRSRDRVGTSSCGLTTKLKGRPLCLRPVSQVQLPNVLRVSQPRQLVVDEAPGRTSPSNACWGGSPGHKNSVPPYSLSSSPISVLSRRSNGLSAVVPQRASSPSQAVKSIPVRRASPAGAVLCEQTPSYIPPILKKSPGNIQGRNAGYPTRAGVTGKVQTRPPPPLSERCAEHDLFSDNDTRKEKNPCAHVHVLHTPSPRMSPLPQVTKPELVLPPSLLLAKELSEKDIGSCTVSPCRGSGHDKDLSSKAGSRSASEVSLSVASPKEARVGKCGEKTGKEVLIRSHVTGPQIPPAIPSNSRSQLQQGPLSPAVLSYPTVKTTSEMNAQQGVPLAFTTASSMTSAGTITKGCVQVVVKGDGVPLKPGTILAHEKQPNYGVETYAVSFHQRERSGHLIILWYILSSTLILSFFGLLLLRLH